MIFSLKIDGRDYRVRISAENQADKKLLGFINEHDSADLVAAKEDWGQELKYIELCLKTRPVKQEDKPIT